MKQCVYYAAMIKMPALPRFITWLLSIGFTLCIVGAIGIMALWFYFSQDLPDYSKLANYHPAAMSRIYASDGTLIGEYAKEKRIFLPLSRIPLKVRQAFIAAEDKNFYHHQGIDAMGIARALAENARQIGAEQKSLAGGSTITQQVVKNFLLTREKSLTRKAKEAILSFRITNVYSKDKILELYLNEIYLGLGAHGVAVAAQRYFNKPLEELTTEQIALLAAMPKAPSMLDPRHYKERAQERRNYVITRMAEDGYINDTEAQRAKAAPLVISMGDAENKDIKSISWFPEEARRRISEMYGEEQVFRGGYYVKTTVVPEMQRSAEKALREALIAYDRRHGYRGPLATLKLDDASGGWKKEFSKLQAEYAPQLFYGEKLALVTDVTADKAEIVLPNGTISSIAFEHLKWARKFSGASGAKDVVKVGDVIIAKPYEKELPANKEQRNKEKDSQEPAQEPVKETYYKLHQIPKVNGAMMAMDPYTGRILAMVGGYSSVNQFNRATQALRQPGSAFKPFVYLTALERGFSPTTIIVDAPVELYQGPGLPMWRPKNYEEETLGPATLRMGLEKSRNMMTVRLAQRLGIKKIVRVGQRFGIYGDKLPANYSMVLGSVETTLERLMGAYSMIANGGYRVKPNIIERVDDVTGKTVYRMNQEPCELCQADNNGATYTADAPNINDTRERVLDPRVAYQMQSLLQGVVQRGTATTAKVLGMPIGGKTGTTNESRDVWFMGVSADIVVGVYIGYDQPATLGKKETGGRVSLPAYIAFMKENFGATGVSDFRMPKGIVQAHINYRTGTPAAEGEGQVITENFITGGPIYIPETEEQRQEDAQQDSISAAPIMEPTATSGTDGDMTEGSDADSSSGEEEPAPQVNWEKIGQTPGAQVTSDTYNNYREYRKRQAREQQAPAPSSEEPASMGTGGLY